MTAVADLVTDGADLPVARSAPRPPEVAVAAGAGRMGDSLAVERLRSLLQVSRPGATWWRELDARLCDLAGRLAADEARAGGADGWYAQVIADAPRMQATVGTLMADHAEIVARIGQIRSRLAAPTADPRRAPREIAAVADLLDRVVRHQRRVRAALSDTYLIDLGGE